MASQVDDDLHSGEDVDQNQPHEKKSVLRKVKDKARKLKGTFAKHSRSPVSDEHHVEEEDDDDDDDDDEMEDSPEIHGAPIYDSAPMRDDGGKFGGVETGTHAPVISSVSGTNGNRVDDCSGKVVNKEKSKVSFERVESDPRNPAPSFVDENIVNDDVTKSVDHGDEGNQSPILSALGRSPVPVEDPHGPKDGLEARYPSNYQSKVSDPTGSGGEEAKITPILESFGKMSVHDEPESKPNQNPQFVQPRSPTETHDQFSPELSQAKKTDSDHLPPETISPRNQSTTYTEKLSYAASAIAGTAISAKDVLASKLGYGAPGQDDTKIGERETDTIVEKESEFSGEKKKTETPTTLPAQVGEYGRKVASTVTATLSPVYGNVAGAGTTVISKFTGTGTDSGTGEKTEDVVKQSWSEKLKPGEEDKALSEAMLEVLHMRKEEDSDRKEEKPAMGKVTESDHVKECLGTGEGELGLGGGKVDSGDVKVNAAGDSSVVNKGMVNMVKGTVSSWFGKGETEQGAEGGEGKVHESSK